MGTGAVTVGRELAAASWGRGLGKREAEVARGLTGIVEGKGTGTGGVAGEGEGEVAAPAPKARAAEPGPRLRGPASRPKPDAAMGAASRSGKP